MPKIGKRVDIAVGATLLGAITVGDDAKIGPYSIVTRSVPAGATTFAAPARVIKAPAPAEPAAGETPDETPDDRP